MTTSATDLMLPQEKYTRAYAQYMLHHTASDICEALDITDGKLREWVHEGSWLKRRQQITNEAVAKADAELRATVIAERMPVVRAQLSTAGKLAKKADDLVNEAETGRDLADTARAFRSAADVQSRILGLDDAAREAVNTGKPRVIMAVFPTAAEAHAPTEPKPVEPVIDVPVVDHDGDEF